MKGIICRALNNNEISVRYDKAPDKCPLCHRHVLPKLISGHIPSQDVKIVESIQIVFQCPNDRCNKLFIGYYYNRNISPSDFFFRFSAPRSPEKVQFSDKINDLSPSFVEIYNQAIAAEGFSLTEIVGVGLRKALEFLIKDFIINQNPEKEEEIKQAHLAKCIKDYIEDALIKETALRAAWLGNDETHYIRKWTKKDISDLKILIKLTLNFIENILLVKHYKKEMPG